MPYLVIIYQSWPTNIRHTSLASLFSSCTCVKDNSLSLKDDEVILEKKNKKTKKRNTRGVTLRLSKSQQSVRHFQINKKRGIDQSLNNVYLNDSSFFSTGWLSGEDGGMGLASGLSCCTTLNNNDKNACICRQNLFQHANSCNTLGNLLTYWDGIHRRNLDKLNNCIIN